MNNRELRKDSSQRGQTLGAGVTDAAVSSRNSTEIYFLMAVLSVSIG